MKTDAYLKGVLTIIAACLLLMVGNQLNLIPTVSAEASPGPGYAMVPVNEDGSINVQLTGVAPDADMDVVITGIRTYDELEVELVDINTSDELPVNIKRISTNDELDVNIDEIGGAFLSSGGPVPVREQ